MIWATKRIRREDLPSIEDLFRDQAASFDEGRQMLLVCTDEAWPDIRVWVAVPESGLLTPYYGFASCRRADLPPAPVLIAGCRERFGAIFHGP